MHIWNIEQFVTQFFQFCVIPGDISALKSVWLLGNEFLRNMEPSFWAAKQASSSLYLTDNYNTKILYAEQWSNIRPFLAWVFNQLIKVLNEPPYILPRYILIMLDRDLITIAELFDYGVLHTIEDTLQWLLKKINQVIETRKQDLMGKRPGAVSTTSEPRLVWVSMLRRPDNLLNKQVHALAWKFNEVLEQVISGNQHSHFLKMEFDKSLHILAIIVVHTNQSHHMLDKDPIIKPNLGTKEDGTMENITNNSVTFFWPYSFQKLLISCVIFLGNTVAIIICKKLC